MMLNFSTFPELFDSIGVYSTETRNEEATG